MTTERLSLVFDRCLGAGGFGEVYLARQRTVGGLERQVAVKVLRGEFDENSDSVKRLRDEGQLLGLLAHPAILGVHQFAMVDGRLALITEYVEGIDVARLCSAGNTLSAKVSLGIIGEVAAALDHAYNTKNPHTGKTLKLVHRDVKPENIRISKSGQVKLLDFGIARSTEMQRRAKTAMGDVLMTPGYGAPEAMAFGVTSPAVDVYALGATLFKMLTGEKLFGERPIDFQLNLAMDSQDYGDFLKERVTKVKEPEVRALVGDMVAFVPENRPTAGTTSERCEDLIRTLTGPTFHQWARTASFAEESSAMAGSLDGKNITVSGIIAGSQAPVADLSPPPQKVGAPSGLPLGAPPGRIVAGTPAPSPSRLPIAPPPPPSRHPESAQSAPAPPPHVRSMPGNAPDPKRVPAPDQTFTTEPEKGKTPAPAAPRSLRQSITVGPETETARPSAKNVRTAPQSPPRRAAPPAAPAPKSSGGGGALIGLGLGVVFLVGAGLLVFVALIILLVAMN